MELEDQTQEHSMTRHARMNQIEELLTKPMTWNQISEAIDLSKGPVLLYLRMLTDANRIHVGAWDTSKPGRTARMYLRGPGPDVPKPPTREEVKASPVDPDGVRIHMGFKQRRPKVELTEAEIFQRPATVVNVHRDPLIAALFGSAEKTREAA